MRALATAASLALSLTIMLVAAPSASAADFASSTVAPRDYAWSHTQSFSGSCYLENGVSWTFTARWNFGYTSRQTIKVNSVAVSYRMTGGGTAGTAFLQDANGRGVWENNYNNRAVPRGSTYSQTFDTAGAIATQGPNGASFQVLVQPGECGGTGIRAIFNIRST